MRVLIDATSVLVRSAGVKNYIYYWIQHLREHARNERILAFPYLNELGALTHERSMISPYQTYLRLAVLHAANYGPRQVIDWIARDADVFHVSSLIRQVPHKVKITATVYDMTTALFPEVHTAANVRADVNFSEQTLKRASRLLAISENTKRDLVRLLKIDERRVDVVYPGVPEVFFGAKGRPADRPYLLFVGTIEPRKNVDTLLDAWQSAGLSDDFDLLIAGPEGWASEKTMARLRSGMAGVKYLGYVPEDELPGLTAGARAFVYPSLYEGFGFPVAQAMAARVPVVTSNTSCLPEVAGDGALYADPHSASELAQQLRKVLTSPSLAAELGSAGAARATHYRWDECAKRSLEFFRKATDHRA